MQMKKTKQPQRIFLLVLIFVFGLFQSLSLFAAGKRDINTQTADGLEIWQQEFDLSELKPGKYNILVEAKDAAGNTAESGPFNIKVDPNAGLPIARVVYPENNAIMRRDINLIGVASGRFGVQRVMVRLDDAEYHPAEGTDYWNRVIDIRTLAEGKHTIYAQAFDSKNTAGPEYSVSFLIDKAPPSVELTSHKTGDLISGNVTMAGRADDANGIASVALSATGGADFKALSFKTKRGETGVSYSFPVKTKGLDDGPVVYYIKATDKTGISVTKPYLFFVDNNGPDLAILSPVKDEDVWGNVQISGSIHDTVGLEKFYYEWAGTQVDIPLRPGDPFWTAAFEISAAQNRNSPIKITAVDKSGNVTTVSQKLPDTRKFKAPTLIIDYPSPAGLNNLAPDQMVYGHIAPGFFASSLILEGLLGGIPEGVEARSAFRIDPYLLDQAIPVGKRGALKIWAMDDDGVTGDPVSVRINRPAPKAPAPPKKGASEEEIAAYEASLIPVELIDSPITINSPEKYSYSGSAVAVQGKVTASGSVRLEYRLFPEDGWMPVTMGGDGSFTANIGLSHLEEGPVHLEFRTVQRDVENIPLYFPINKSNTAPEINFVSPLVELGSMHGNVTVSGDVTYFIPLKEIAYSLDGKTYTPLEFTARYNKAWFSYLCDFSALNRAGGALTIRATDISGLVAEGSPNAPFDDSTDAPVPIVNAPVDQEVVTGDFEISGVAFDDDGVGSVNWRIIKPGANAAAVEYNKLITSQSFQIAIPFADVIDGENIIEVFAEDIYGVRGETVTRTIRVSTAPPETIVTEPALDIYNRGVIVVSGTAQDNNGIADVLVSMDNGNSYQKADGAESWKLNLNTAVYLDGVYSVLIRSVDKYGIEAFSNALINIDNTPPEITLGAPANGDSAGSVLSVTGEAHDNITLKSLSLQLVNIADPRQKVARDMAGDFVIMEQINVSSLSNGAYNLKLNAVDLAGNETTVTRDITIATNKSASEVALINPMPGVIHSGPLFVSGKVTGAVIPNQVTLMVNGERFAAVDVDRYGVFHYQYPEERLTAEQTLVISAVYDSPSGERISSYESEIKAGPFGPSISVDSHQDGDVITRRPWISGRAWIATPAPEAGDPPVSRKEKAALAAQDVSISFDNGRSFNKVQGKENWKYRLETGDLAAGPLPILIKAEFAEGQTAVRRIILTVDTLAPLVTTVDPSENSTYRDSMLVYGAASDDFEIDSVAVSLRPGDKAGYSVPGFIQGLYLDANFLGATFADFGFGLTFFEDNVKLQFQAGWAPPGRFTGVVAGFKLLANVYSLPFAYYFGPDWEFFSMSVAIGANFSYFSMDEGQTPLVMGAVLGQWEFARADLSYFFPKWKYFKTVALYIEPIFWFASSDVSAGAIFRCTLGTRFSLF
jgi:hypothetical protein